MEIYGNVHGCYWKFMFFFHGCYWKCMQIYGLFHGCYWKFMFFSWMLLEIYGNLCFFLKQNDVTGNLWIVFLLDVTGYLWIFSWMLLEFYGFLFIGCCWKFMDCFMYATGNLWIFI